MENSERIAAALGEIYIKITQLQTTLFINTAVIVIAAIVIFLQLGSIQRAISPPQPKPAQQEDLVDSISGFVAIVLVLLLSFIALAWFVIATHRNT